MATAEPRLINVSAGGNSLVLLNVPCDSSVYVGAMVKLINTVAFNALADNFGNSRAIGLCYEKVTATLCHVLLEGLSEPIFTGLNENQDYFLSTTTDGALTTSFPTGEYPKVIFRLGRPYGSTRFLLHMSAPIGRTDPAPPPPPSGTQPDNFAGLALWLRADDVVKDGSGFVSQWNDKSGLIRDFVDIGRQPQWQDAIIGGEPAIYFDDTPLRHTSGAQFLDTGAKFDIFIVWKADDSSGTNSFCSLKDNSSFGYRWNQFGLTGYNTQSSNIWAKINFSATLATGIPYYANHRYDGVDPFAFTSRDIYHNGSILGTKFASGGGGGQQSYVGGWGAPVSGDHLKGWIAEFILYNPGLSTADRQDLEDNYIKDRYGF